MAKKTKKPAARKTVRTNFKQNTPRRRNSSASSATPASKTPAEFDPDANVRQVGADMEETPAPAMPAAEMPAPAESSGLAGRSIPRFPDEA